jgi:hypothetical protein
LGIFEIRVFWCFSPFVLFIGDFTNMPPQSNAQVLPSVPKIYTR